MPLTYACYRALIAGRRDELGLGRLDVLLQRSTRLLLAGAHAMTSS
ncbi:MAG: hypothetical protein ACRDVZ_06265 [Jiangellaceae bacterium]